MAICKVCGREMLVADGCNAPNVIYNGKLYPRVKVGGDLILIL